MRFRFGKNWRAYVRTAFNEERLAISQRHLVEFLGLSALSGKSFLDIGCGAGIHSLAAIRSGARSIFSFDFDEDAVAASREVWRLAGRPSHWHIERGDVLDERYMRSLPTSDIVYSWGVLHHTGDMWRAVTHASIPLKPSGLFYIALYSKDLYGKWGLIESSLALKKKYNQSGPLMRLWLEWRYAWESKIRDDVLALRNPFRTMTDYKKQRGMSFWVSVRDWVGGWPMEFAGDQETIEFCSNLGLEPLRIETGGGNTEFLFRRSVH